MFSSLHKTNSKLPLKNNILTEQNNSNHLILSEKKHTKNSKNYKAIFFESLNLSSNYIDKYKDWKVGKYLFYQYRIDSLSQIKRHNV